MRSVAPLAALVVACTAPPERPPVGRTTRDFVDPERFHFASEDPRPLATTIWYPTSAAGPERPWTAGVFRLGWGLPDAPLAPEPARRPTVLLSPGPGGSAAQLSWLAESLASRGFIVAAVDHHGNSTSDRRPHGFALWWEQPRDLTVVLDKLSRDPTFGPHIDVDRIAAAGYSVGGYAALALAGVRVSVWQHYDFCDREPQSSFCRPPPDAAFDAEVLKRLAKKDNTFRRSLRRFGRSYRDARVKAAIAVAPALAPALVTESLKDTDVPALLLAGDRDEQTPVDQARPIADALPHGTLEVLPNVAHSTFLPSCTLWGRFFTAACGEPGGADRDTVHRRVATRILDFLDDHLATKD